MSFSVGDTIGAYRVVEELGRGGMGQVFKVEHTITRRLEALKVLEGGRPDAPEQAARSLREIQVQSSLDHPNIAAVHNAFWIGEDLVLVMELIEGRTLGSLLESGRLPLATTIDYACQALSALNYAHAAGVIHGDVSPSNLMVSRAGVLKLTDFGLSKGPADLRASRSGSIVGSLFYMSPEQVRGSRSIDARSDVYSLGAVLYELTTGKKPFDGESAYSIMVDQVNKPPTPPIELVAGLPNPLNNAILQSLEKDPTKRFQTAEEFRLALMGIHLQPTSHASRSRIAWAAAAIVVAALAAAGIRTKPWHRPANEQGVAVVVPAPAAPEPPPAPRSMAKANVQRLEKRAVDPPPRTEKADADAIDKPSHNRLTTGLRKLWHLVHRKRSSATDDQS